MLIIWRALLAACPLAVLLPLTQPSQAAAPASSQPVANDAVYTVVGSLQAAAEAVQRDPNLNYIMVSDGTHSALFEKGKSQAAVTANWNNAVWGADFQQSVPLVAFIQDASNPDITQALQQALNTAAKLHLGVEMPANGQYVATDTIMVPGEATFLHGNQSAITFKSASKFYALRLGTATVISQFELSGLTLNLNNLPKVLAIWGNDISNLHIHDINIVNAASAGISFRPVKIGLNNITIENSNIVLNWAKDMPENHYYGINIENILKKSNRYTGRYALWQEYLETGAIPDNAYPATNIKIRNNRISGGYYGISIQGVSNSEISNNLIENNMRNISMQNNTSNNLISHNQLTRQSSSSIHVAYQSNGNKIENNHIVTDSAHMQALLQAYQNSDNNTFRHNRIEILRQPGPGWAMYSGTDSDGTTFSGNIISGPVSKTVIGVEAIWDSRSTRSNPAAYMNIPLKNIAQSRENDGGINYNGGRGSVRNITISGNIIDPNNPKAPVVYAGADTSTGHDGNQKIIGAINNLTISNNIVFGNSSRQYSDFVQTHKNGAPINRLSQKNNSLRAPAKGGQAAGNTFYSPVSATLPANTNNLTLLGSSALNGTGNSANNIITGNAYNNVLSGGDGNDTLIGGGGRNTLSGGNGSDTFVFDSSFKGGQFDQITDFTVGTDKIGLSPAIFGQLNGSDWFTASGNITPDTRIIQSNSQLFYDADGSEQYFKPVKFAELNTASPLSINSFVLLPH